MVKQVSLKTDAVSPFLIEHLNVFYKRVLSSNVSSTSHEQQISRLNALIGTYICVVEKVLSVNEVLLIRRRRRSPFDTHTEMDIVALNTLAVLTMISGLQIIVSKM